MQLWSERKELWKIQWRVKDIKINIRLSFISQLSVLENLKRYENYKLTIPGSMAFCLCKLGIDFCLFVENLQLDVKKPVKTKNENLPGHLYLHYSLKQQLLICKMD